MTRRAGIALVGAFFAAPYAAVAADIKPLEMIVESGAQRSDIALHCAGLFHSVWDFAGGAVLGAEATEQAKSNAALFLEAGTQMRMAENGEAQTEASQTAVKDAFAVSTLYYKLYEANVAAGGDAFASDPIWNSDLEICRNMAAQL